MKNELKKDIEKLVNRIVKKVWNEDCDCTKEEMKKEYYDQISSHDDKSLCEYLEDIKELGLLNEIEELSYKYAN